MTPMTPVPPSVWLPPLTPDVVRARPALRVIEAPWQGHTLRLEPQVARHAAALWPQVSDPLVYVLDGGAPPSVSLARFEQRLASLEARHSPDGREQWFNWVVRLPVAEPAEGEATHEGVVAGYVQATVRDTSAQHGDAGVYTLVAYVLGQAFWRRGIGTAAVGAMLDELRDHHGVTRACAILKQGNVPSVRLLERLGFEIASASDLPGSDIESGELAMQRHLA